MRVEDAYNDWQDKRRTQAEAARLLGVYERTFRRQIDRYEADGMDGLIDRRLEQVLRGRASVDEVVKLVDLYRRDYAGWNVQHFHGWYRREHGGVRNHTWMKSQLQQAGIVKWAKALGKHRKKPNVCHLRASWCTRTRAVTTGAPDMTGDLVVTLDDATGEHLSMFFCQEEGTASSFYGVGETIARHCLFCALYPDRGSHYFHTPEAGGKIDRSNPT